MSEQQKHCLLLGGLGFLGNNLCRALRNKYRISIYARNQLMIERFKLDNSDIDVIKGDFSHELDFARILDDVDVVFHLISTTKPSNLDMLYEFDSNVIPTMRFLESCKGRKIRLIFFSSGGTVYGIKTETPISEDETTDPISSYGIQKLTIEKCIEYYGRMYNLDYLIFRIANPYGPCHIVNITQGVIPIFLSKILKHEVVEIWGDGKVIRDYIFVKDVITACQKGIDYHGTYRLFNVGTGKGYSLLEILHIMEGIVPNSLTVKFYPTRRQDVPSNCLDSSRLQKEFNWKPEMDLESGIRYMASIWNEETLSFDE